jgi:Domain of unknown function (DUF5666)
MRKMRTAAIVLGAILAVPVAGFPAANPVSGQAKTATAKTTTAKSTSSVSSHLTRGVVKSIDSSSLVIEQGTGKSKKDMTFVLDTATRREGEINVGSTVAVRYKNDASKKLMALDIQSVKGKTAAPKTAAR